MYKIKEYEYRKYLELRGTRESSTPFALELRDHNARYFVIEKDDKFYDDFGIYKENNYMSLARKNYQDKELVSTIKDFLKEEGYEYIVAFIPLNNDNNYFNEDDIYSMVKKLFSRIDEQDYTENNTNYKKMTLYL